MPDYLKTRRLRLRSLRPEDAQAIFSYRNDPRCYRFQRWEDTSLDAVKAMIAEFGADVFLSRKPEQHYSITTLDGTLVGDMAYFDTDQDNCVTLGITISPAFQGQSCAFELLTAVCDAIRARHPGMDIVALIDKENKPSLSLLEKLGFCRECYAESIASYVYVKSGISQSAAAAQSCPEEPGE